MDAAICQAGGGTLDDRRRIITNGLTGGIRLATVASVPLGSRLIGCHSIIGNTMVSITGVSSACASRSSFTAAPMAAISAAMVMKAIRK